MHLHTICIGKLSTRHTNWLPWWPPFLTGKTRYGFHIAPIQNNWVCLDFVHVASNRHRTESDGNLITVVTWHSYHYHYNVNLILYATQVNHWPSKFYLTSIFTIRSSLNLHYSPSCLTSITGIIIGHRMTKLDKELWNRVCNPDLYQCYLTSIADNYFWCQFLALNHGKTVFHVWKWWRNHVSQANYSPSSTQWYRMNRTKIVAILIHLPGL